MDEFKTEQAPSGPCNCTGNEILCINIPGPITLVILGMKFTFTIPCINLGAAQPLTPEQKDFLAKIFGEGIYKLAL
jgi:hypothetical protein